MPWKRHCLRRRFNARIPRIVFIVLTLCPATEMSACVKCGRADLATFSCPSLAVRHAFPRSRRTRREPGRASAALRFGKLRPGLPSGGKPLRIRRRTQRRGSGRVGAASRGHVAGTLLALGVPSSGPPASSPELSGFTEIWNGLRLNHETPVDELLEGAMKFNGPNLLAKQILGRRTDLPELAVAVGCQREAASRRPLPGGKFPSDWRGHPGALGANRLRRLDKKETTELYYICSTLRAMGPAAQSTC